MISRSLAANRGSFDSLKRCGPMRLQAMFAQRGQMRCTELDTDAGFLGHSGGRPVRRLAGRIVQRAGDHTHSPPPLPATGGATDGSCRVASRRPHRSCSVSASATLLSCWWRCAAVISAVPQPSAVNSTICARQTCFCGLFRSATIAAKLLAIRSSYLPDYDTGAHPSDSHPKLFNRNPQSDSRTRQILVH